MKALHVIKNTDPSAMPSSRVEVVEKPIPTVGDGEVLIKMTATTCNPSDLSYMRGEYGLATNYDKVAGLEGTGIVVDAGEGPFGKTLMGMRVACSSKISKGYDGTWAEYMVTDATLCMPIIADIPDEMAATLIVNPFTVFSLLDRAEELGAKAVVQNAAASQVGKLVECVAKRRGIKVISTVRRLEQKDRLIELGAEHVLITTDADFDQQLKSLSRELEASVFFDCVAGVDSAKLLTNMPRSTTAIVYGRLNTDATDIYGGHYSVGHMIFADTKIEGFWLSSKLVGILPEVLLARSAEIQNLFKEGALTLDVRGHYNIEDFAAAMDDYALNMSKGKAILKF
jgi:NADPH:quinone reductase-like Zn-dependent oxidoreductase